MQPAATGSPPLTERHWQIVRWTILALALLSRLWWLDGRPPHFDEGVNGWFTDQMKHLGCYEYDPTNYHGPLHFYVLFLFKCLFGRNLWALRLPTALIGVLTVDWCFRFSRFFGWPAATLCAIALLVSPGEMYFQRDAIHEAWLVFFLVLGCWGICGLWQEGTRGQLWATGLAFAGIVLTKETYVIHLGCLALALIVVFLLESWDPSRRSIFAGGKPANLPHLESADLVADPVVTHSWVTVPDTTWLSPRLTRAIAPQRWSQTDLWTVVGVSFALIIFFYSGNFFHWKGVEGLVTAYKSWGHKANVGEGHEKPFFYWCKLIARNEPWAILGAAACFRYAVPALPRDQTKWRAWAIGAACLCLAAVAGTQAWTHSQWDTWKGFPFVSPHFKGGALAWLGGTVALLVGSIGVAWLARRRGVLVLCGALAIAGCVGALWLPKVQTNVPLFGIVLVGLAAGVSSLSLPTAPDWRVRWIAVYGVGTLVAYSIINYKTPWCVASILWPFFFVAGVGIVEWIGEGPAVAWRSVGIASASAATLISTFLALNLNFRHPTDEKFGYVYVQSFDDVWTVTNDLLEAARRDPMFYHQPGLILCGSTYPLPWLLGDFEHIGYYADDMKPDGEDAYHVDFLLVQNTRVAEVEPHLRDDYYKEPIHLRPALGELQLYLRAKRFGPQMPKDRPPEFHPTPEGEKPLVETRDDE